jgi:hypothetical protein
MAECIGHLNLTAEACLPLLWGAIQRGQGLGRSWRRRYSRDPIGWLLGRMWITSPFDRRIRYNAYSCFTILPRHEHRHLWQAEQVWSALQQQGSV